jgi:hypothetical protein
MPEILTMSERTVVCEEMVKKASSKETPITIEEIEIMTQESACVGKTFYISPFVVVNNTTKSIDLGYVADQVSIIIKGGKRYLVKGQNIKSKELGGLKFIKIERRDVDYLINKE